MVDLVENTENARQTFGEKLRQTRESAGLRLEDIVGETKVSKTIFESMEQGVFTSLPERVFSRSFVAQYARTARADESPLLELFDLAWAEHETATDSRTDLVALDAEVKPSIHWRFWFPMTAGLVIAVVAAVAILGSSTTMNDGLARDPRRSGAKPATQTPEIKTPTQPVPVSRSPVVELQAATDAMVELTVSVRPGEECWIHYRDRDGMTGQHLLANGQTLPLALAGPVKLTVGNAGAVEIRLGEKILGDLGLPGQVIHTEVTRDGLTRHGENNAEPS